MAGAGGGGATITLALITCVLHAWFFFVDIWETGRLSAWVEC